MKLTVMAIGPCRSISTGTSDAVYWVERMWVYDSLVPAHSFTNLFGLLPLWTDWRCMRVRFSAHYKYASSSLWLVSPSRDVRFFILGPGIAQESDSCKWPPI